MSYAIYLINMKSNNLTVVYLTASILKPSFAHIARCILLNAIQDTPIISVSREKLDFGTNIIDDGEKGVDNIYRQMLRAAKIAETDFIAIAEDDCLYHEDHFLLRPKEDEFLYDQNRFALFTWGRPTYSWRDRRSNCSLIAPRLLLIEALEERFAKYPDKIPDELVGELGRARIDRNLGVTERKSVNMFAETSIIQFNHENSSEDRQRCQRKRLGQIKAFDLYHWGRAEDLIKLYGKD